MHKIKRSYRLQFSIFFSISTSTIFFYIFKLNVLIEINTNGGLKESLIISIYGTFYSMKLSSSFLPSILLCFH